MLEKLHVVKQRFDEVSDLIIQPDVIKDQKRYVQLNKEYKDLKSLMDKREFYISFTNNIEESQEIIDDGSDAEMVEMAKMQMDEAKGALPASSASIHLEIHKHHLLPGFSPGKLHSGRGVDKSFPCVLENSRNSCVTIAHKICVPESS